MIEKKVQYFLKKHECDLTKKSVAVWVSGGPDSLALLHLLWRYKQKLQMNIMAIHVDHMFRGEESYQDAMFVHEFCRNRGIAFEMTRANVPQYM
uniref:ATP-binding protein n=1 Tax=Enterococcus faecium TaxID=1352 RepID=UPI0030C7C1EA